MRFRSDSGRSGIIAPPLFACLSVWLLGCSGDVTGGDSPRTVVRDSAGIEIVENAIREDASVVIEASAEPRLTIGAIEGDQVSQLHRVRGAVRLPDGRIAVLNAGTYEVRIYDTDGTLVTRFGHAGEGPEEFAGFPVQLTLLPPDTLAVWEFPTWNLSYFRLDGTFLHRELGHPTYQDLLSDDVLGGDGYASPHEGLYLFTERIGAPPPLGEVFTRENHLKFVGRDSTVRDIHAPGGSEQVRLQTEQGPRTIHIPFGTSGVTAFGGRPLRVWTGRDDCYELWQFDADGDLLRIVRGDRSPRPVTKEDVERLFELSAQAIEGGMPEEQARSFLGLMRRATVADSMPVFGPVFVTGDGGAWIMRTLPATDNSETRPPEYDVFGPDGRWLGLAHAPKGVQPLEIGADYFLGLRRDDLGVEHVELYGLGPPSVAR